MARYKSLGDRMKAYEGVYKNKLMPRSITIIRLDGRGFSKFTSNLEKPFDRGLFEAMEETTKYLVKNVQGCKLGYYQSDEISLIITDYDDYDTQAFFDGEVSKILSITASMATAKFNRHYSNGDKLAMFDSRVMQIPSVTEAINCIKWRQQDAVRNSIQASARSIYSHSECNNKNTNQLQELIFLKSEEFKNRIAMCGWGANSEVNMSKDNFNWNDLPSKLKRGTCVFKSGVNYISTALDLKREDDVSFLRTLIPILDDFYEIENED